MILLGALLPEVIGFAWNVWWSQLLAQWPCFLFMTGCKKFKNVKLQIPFVILTPRGKLSQNSVFIFKAIYLEKQHDFFN